MSEITKERLVRDFSKAILRNEAALFIGAGLSAGAGYVDWRGLLRDIANDLNLQVDQEHDLISLAQYEFNRNQNRSRLNAKIIEEFRDRAQPTASHEWIARLPIDTVWTTNYDKLLENAFAAVSKAVDVKHRVPDLLHRKPYADVTILKMHGDVDFADEAVLIKDDYERYESRRGPFVGRLQGDLTWRHFLFLGFSFADPNIDYIFSRLRCLLAENAKDQPPRYCILRRPAAPKRGTANYSLAKAQFDRDTRHLPHRIADLARFNIDVVLIERFDEIPELLKEISLLVSSRNVFISGSAHDYPLGRDKTESFCRRLGAALISSEHNLVSGFGLGIGGACILGAYEEVKRTRYERLGQRLRLFPFPQDFKSTAEREKAYSDIRGELIQESGVTIFISGNKLDSSGKVVLADGVMEEFRLAKEHGHVLIPIPASGWAAHEIWQQMRSQLAKYFPGVNVEKEFSVLSNPDQREDKWVETILAILKRSRKL